MASGKKLTPEGGPAIILVEPQLGENIGAAARAMANFGLGDLRLVTPRDGWPNKQGARGGERRRPTSSTRRASSTSTEEAIADLNFVYATTARIRDLPKQVVGPREAVGGAAGAHRRRAGDRHPLRARALGPHQRGDRARRRDRHVSGQPEIRVAQHRAGGAADELRVDGGGARRRAADARRRARARPHAGAEGASHRADASTWRRRSSRPAISAPTDMKPTMVQNLRAILQRAGFTARRDRRAARRRRGARAAAREARQEASDG